MNKKLTLILIVLLTGGSTAVGASLPPPDIPKIMEEISQDNIEAVLKKLESFHTRHTLSSRKKDFGIWAAADWIKEKFMETSPRLKVFFDDYTVKPQGSRFQRDIDIRNVVAVLPGQKEKGNERIFLVNAHYDSYARPEDPQHPQNDFDNYAPGVNDDASGVAALLEMARVFSPYEFDATIYFVAFSGEEIGLVGSTLMARRMKEEGKNICGVIGLDMLGNIQGGDGFIENQRIRVFSSGPDDSPSRRLARYAKRTGEYYSPSAEVQLIFRADRFGRGGDHTPFVLEGWPGVRMMEANENYSRQHTVHDTLENLSLDYCTRNIRIAASVLGSLAAAPPSPSITTEQGRPMLGRGGSGYDAHLKWEPVDCRDLAAYKVYWRRTSTPFWEHSVEVGLETEFILHHLSIDEYVFGVSALNKKGHESIISAYVMPPRQKRTYSSKS
ncbi:MAG: M28 family metallopeptidase [Candidatus Aminicenantes bacterium]